MREPLILALCIAALLAIPVSDGAARDRIATASFTESDEVIVNPYMGYAPWAASLTERDVRDARASLAFALLSWRDFEPQKGIYDFDAFERRNNLALLRDHNIRLVMRVVCDYPGSEAHVDIPQWLYDETGGAGAFYTGGDLHGFAPDYTNAYIQRRHALMIRALAERYDDPAVVAFVQLGSLGHWGEWHHSLMDGAAFPEEIADLYARHYLDAFKRVKLQMRRPVAAAKAGGMGLYNDMMGIAEATYAWLGWIEASEMGDFHLSAPSGGEFASTHALEDYFGAMYADVKQMLVDSHASYVSCFPPGSGKRGENADDLLKTLGYRLAAVRASYTPEVAEDGALTIELAIKNTGVAPFYYDWPFFYYFVDRDGRVAATVRSGRDVRTILPDHACEHADEMTLDLPPGEYTIKLGLVDPDTGLAVRFANRETDDAGLLIIGDIRA